MKDLTLKTAKLSVKIMLISVLIIVLTIATIIGYGFFYSKDKAKLKISDFSAPKTVTLTPYKWKLYAMLNIKVKGFVNDTIIIKNTTSGYYGKKSYNDIIGIRLTGKIDTIWKTDYYNGEGSRTFTFDPYKATEGELEIEIGL